MCEWICKFFNKYNVGIKTVVVKTYIHSYVLQRISSHVDRQEVLLASMAPYSDLR